MLKFKQLLICVLALTLMGFQTKKGKKPKKITMATLLEEMIDRTDITYYPVNDFDCKQFSSHDRRSDTNPNNNLWFANDDWAQFIRKEQTDGRTEYVMLDHQGPGSIVRFWITGNGDIATKYTLRFYIDGSKTPVIEGKALDLISKGKLVGAPLSASVSPNTFPYFQRGHNLYLPIPYGKSCKITATHDEGKKPHFFYYNINYRAYKAGTKVESFSKSTLAQNKALIDRVQAKLKSGTGEQARIINEKAFAHTLEAGQTHQMAFNKEAAIQRIGVKLKAKDLEQALRSTIVKMNFDGEQTVWCPLGEFFGIGYKSVPTKTRYHKVDADGYMSALWVMPFQKNCQITFENLGNQPVEIHGDIALQEYDWNKNSMHFHASWKQYTGIETGDQKNVLGEGKPKDVNFAKLEGKGVYVGDVLNLFNPALAGHWRIWWGEGDEKIYIDGEKLPSHFGTGTEDYYGYAWCKGTVFHHPFISQPIGKGNLTTGYTINSRVRALDKIPFRKSMKFDMELWHWVKTKVNYSPATFYYMLPGGKSLCQPQIAEAKRKIARSRHDVIQPTADKNGLIEGETMYCNNKEAKFTGSFNGNFSGGYLLKCFNISKELSLSFLASANQTANLELKALVHHKASSFEICLNGQPVQTVDMELKKGKLETLIIKQAKLLKGKNKLTFKFKGDTPERKEIGIDCLKILSSQGTAL
ncbi:MAG: DUF2961 domain-containing protein [Cytophagales bacterium]|nr:DUF2961 domain-containing protein [Cytophagales bacterium]